MKRKFLILTFLIASINGFSQEGGDYYGIPVIEKTCECWGNISLALDKKSMVQETKKCLEEGISLFPNAIEQQFGVTKEMNTAVLMDKLFGLFSGSYCSRLYVNLKTIVDDYASKNENSSYMTRIANENCDCIDQISQALSIDDRKKEIGNCLNASIKNNYSSIKQDYNWNNTADQKRFVSDLAIKMKTVCDKKTNESTNSNRTVTSKKDNEIQIAKKTPKSTITHKKSWVRQNITGDFGMMGLSINHEFEFPKSHQGRYSIITKIGRSNAGGYMYYNKRYENESEDFDRESKARITYYKQQLSNTNNDALIFQRGFTARHSDSKILVSAENNSNDELTSVRESYFIPYQILDMCLPKGKHIIEVTSEYSKSGGKINSLPKLTFSYTKK